MCRRPYLPLPLGEVPPQGGGEGNEPSQSASLPALPEGEPSGTRNGNLYIFIGSQKIYRQNMNRSLRLLKKYDMIAEI